MNSPDNFVGISMFSISMVMMCAFNFVCTLKLESKKLRQKSALLVKLSDFVVVKVEKTRAYLLIWFSDENNIDYINDLPILIEDTAQSVISQNGCKSCVCYKVCRDDSSLSDNTKSNSTCYVLKADFDNSNDCQATAVLILSKTIGLRVQSFIQEIKAVETNRFQTTSDKYDDDRLWMVGFHMSPQYTTGFKEDWWRGLIKMAATSRQAGFKHAVLCRKAADVNNSSMTGTATSDGIKLQSDILSSLTTSVPYEWFHFVHYSSNLSNKLKLQQQQSKNEDNEISPNFQTYITKTIIICEPLKKYL